MTANQVAASSSSAPGPAPAVPGAYRQVVAEATTDGDYICALHPRTMKRLSVSDGDVVLLKSKRHRETRCIAVSDEEGAERKLKINEAVRSDLRVRLSDTVFVYACPDAKFVGRRGRLRPVEEAAGALKKSLPVKEYLVFTCSFLVSMIIALYSYFMYY